MALSSETIARMRQQYVYDVPVAQILAENKVSQRVFYYWLDGGPRDPARRLPPIPRARISLNYLSTRVPSMRYLAA